MLKTFLFLTQENHEVEDKGCVELELENAIKIKLGGQLPVQRI